ncbi:hypothetical protein, partial [Asaia spathodeae]|uniref:hypothetical protein n=1 Tax=Asaia spathodeae TaxID=657016 RepID=UPI002265C023
MILLLILIIFIAWNFIHEYKPSYPKLRFSYVPRAIANDPSWQTFIKQHCESPAETAFLEAMVVAMNYFQIIALRLSDRK